MAFTFDSTLSTTTANSYVSVEYADDYFTAHQEKETWDCQTTEEKQAILVQATRRIDSEYFHGQKTVRTQSLEWPRNFIYDKDGYPISEDAHPKFLLWATCELALYYLNKDEREVTNSMKEDMKRVKIGPLEYEFRDGRSGDELPKLVQFYLKGIGPAAWRGKRNPSFMVR